MVIKAADTVDADASLTAYRRKRQFDRTPEPKGKPRRSAKRRRALRFIVQKHQATRLHFDFRLELDGVLKSWAVPKGPSLDPRERRLAVQVEDHPIEYGDFEGVIPEGQYGGGTVMLWDRGGWEPLDDPRNALAQGKVTFRLDGERMKGEWTLVRMRGRADDPQPTWLLLKASDEHAQPDSGTSLIDDARTSVTTGRSMAQIAAQQKRVWQSSKKTPTSSAGPSRRKTTTRMRKPAKPVDPASLPQARRASMPGNLSPQLATLVTRIPPGDDWLHEIKFDGYRLLCRLRDGKATLVTRNGNDWTARYPRVAAGIEALPVRQAIVDGELIALDARGASSFQALQNSQRGQTPTFQLHLFDLPYCEGHDLTRVPLLERKRLLERIIRDIADKKARAIIRYSDHVIGHGQKLLESTCAQGLEGVVSKKLDSRYVPGRSPAWTKSKCTRRQEFVVGGYTDPDGAREEFGSLLLGYNDDRGLVYCGRVGTGFDTAMLRQTGARLRAIEQPRTPFAVPPTGSERHGAHWTKPALVAEVEFTQWTDDDRLRHPAFIGWREDKKPAEVIKEQAMPVSKAQAASRRANAGAGSGAASSAHSSRDRKSPSQSRQTDEPAVVAGVTISNPQRPLYPDVNITKLDLAHFYERIGDRILPHIVNRPLTLVRCPKGLPGKCFFQKHLNETMPPAMRGIDIREKDGIDQYLVIDDLAGLISLVQMSTLELHPWGASANNVERCDRLVFDFDPGPGVAWPAVIQAARTAREVLTGVKLKSFVQTSGGKGMHVVAPLRPAAPWDQAKSFAHAVAVFMAQREPDRYLTTMTKARRAGRIFIDYLRNARGATSVAPYSTRARPGAPVATPIRWEELATLRSADRFNVKNLPARLNSLKRDPWHGYFTLKQTLPASIEPKPATRRKRAQ